MRLILCLTIFGSGCIAQPQSDAIGDPADAVAAGERPAANEGEGEGEGERGALGCGPGTEQNDAGLCVPISEPEDVPTCPEGQQRLDGECRPDPVVQECPDGHEWTDGECQPMQGEGVQECPDGHEWADGACHPSQGGGLQECPDGHEWTDGACHPSEGEETPSPRCGDGVLDVGEGCDDGNEVSTDHCVSCALAVCGDGFVQAGVEGCDDGNREDGDRCTNTCTVAKCGDGVVEVGVATSAPDGKPHQSTGDYVDTVVDDQMPAVQKARPNGQKAQGSEIGIIRVIQ